jgi:hypothetical protein
LTSTRRLGAPENSDCLSLHWKTIERGLRTWIAEGSLDDVRLECGDTGDPDAVFQVPLSYRLNGDGDIAFVGSQAPLTRALAKLESVPNGRAYRVVVTFDGDHTHIDGWSPTNSASTNGVSSYAFGGLGAGPDAMASLTHFSRAS